MPTQLHIRPATAEDLPAINAIYNHYVVHSTSTFQVELEPEERRRAWFAGRGAGHPVVVAEKQGKVVGWASLSPYHHRCAYSGTVEDSIYVDPEQRGRKIGTALLEELVELAGKAGHHSVIAVIAADQPASIDLHAKAAFKEVGRLRQAGWKLEQWVDVVLMQRML